MDVKEDGGGKGFKKNIREDSKGYINNLKCIVKDIGKLEVLATDIW